MRAIITMSFVLLFGAVGAVAEDTEAPDPDTVIDTSEQTEAAEDPQPVEGDEIVTLSIEEIISALRNSSEIAEFEPITSAFGIPDALEPVFSKHFEDVFKSDEIAQDFAAGFATEQGEFEVISKEELAIIARNLGMGWINETAAFGSARLPIEDQRRMLEAGLETLKNMQDDLCAAYARGALDPVEVARGEISYLITLPPEEIESYLALVRKAVFAEITDDPPFTPLSTNDQRKAGTVYQEAFLKAIDDHPENALVLEAVNNFDLASDHAVCELTKLSLISALALEGEAGDLIVKLLSSG